MPWKYNPHTDEHDYYEPVSEGKHNDLSGLQGGDINEYYHLTEDGSYVARSVHNEGLVTDPTITWDEDIFDNGTKLGVKIDITETKVNIRNDDEWGANGILYHKTVPAKNLSLQPLGIWYVYVGWNGDDVEYKATQNRGIINNSDIIPVARICSCPEQAELEYVAQYGNIARSSAIRNFDRVMRIRGLGGFERESGFGLSETATRRVNIEAGMAWFGLRRQSLPEVTQDDGTTNTYLYYKTGGVWTRELVTQYNNTEYNDGTNKVEVGVNRFVVNWIYRNFTTDEIGIVLGEGNYTAAQAEVSLMPVVPPRIPSFSLLVGRIIVRKGDNTATAIEEVVTTVLEKSAITEHNDLSNIQGGQADEYYHLTEAELLALQGVDTTFYKLDQTTPQNIDFGDGTGLSFDTVDLFGGGMGIFPRMKFTNSNVVGSPQDLGLIDRGLVIQDDNNQPLLAFAGDSIATKKVGAIVYSNIFGSEAFQITLDITDEDLDEDSRVIWLTNIGTFFVGGGLFTTKLNANTGLKEGIELQGRFLSGVSADGSRTAIKFTDRVGTGFGIERTTGYIAGVLNNNAEASFQGGLELGVFNFNDVNAPIKAIEIDGWGNTIISGTEIHEGATANSINPVTNEKLWLGNGYNYDGVFWIESNSVGGQVDANSGGPAFQIYQTGGDWGFFVSGTDKVELDGDTTIVGDLTVDTNTLHVDSTNNRVGIGTTTPSEKLDVNGNVKASGYKSGTETGQTTTATIVTDVRDNAGQMQKKTQVLTFTSGLLTTKGAESDWTNTTDI